MVTTNISFQENSVPVFLFGADSQIIPSLLSALQKNRLTIANLKESLVRIDLFRSQALLYSAQGDKYSIPIFP
ncbi:hypothetical protein [Paenibacillus periandrae]|uniref:hypothetical protein n=1 Tax=Paenibacillus periandrae TaxID=1761741 RepID=UPI001F088CBE|nr:hypothetical protein [Paenibacillus periandrae]